MRDMKLYIGARGQTIAQRWQFLTAESARKRHGQLADDDFTSSPKGMQNEAVIVVSSEKLFPSLTVPYRTFPPTGPAGGSAAQDLLDQSPHAPRLVKLPLHALVL